MSESLVLVIFYNTRLTNSTNQNDEILFLQNVENVTLKLANKMFINQNYEVKEEYTQDLQTFYRSDIQLVDFSQNQKAANTINTWCKEKTNNRIDRIINAGKEQSHVLYSHIRIYCAIYNDEMRFSYFLYLHE